MSVLNSPILCKNTIILAEKSAGIARFIKKVFTFVVPFGKMLEWLKRHVWKACGRLKRLQGSNPCLSAKQAGLSAGLLAVKAIIPS